jgi:hypothetical protein
MRFSALIVNPVPRLFRFAAKKIHGSMKVTSTEPPSQESVDILCNVMRRPQAILRLEDNEMSSFISRRALAIYLGNGCGEPNRDMDTVHGVYLMFAFAQRPFGYLCNDLYRFSGLYKHMTLEFGAGLMPSLPSASQMLVAPLNHLRGLERVAVSPAAADGLQTRMMWPISGWSTILQILKWWKDTGNTYFRHGRHAQASHFLWRWSRCGDAAMRLSEVVAERGLAPGSVICNDCYSMNVDLCNNLSLSLNKMVEFRRKGPENQIVNVTAQQLNNSCHEADHAFEWPGLLDSQRKKAHYNRTIAFRNKAGWAT